MWRVMVGRVVTHGIGYDKKYTIEWHCEAEFDAHNEAEAAAQELRDSGRARVEIEYNYHRADLDG